MSSAKCVINLVWLPYRCTTLKTPQKITSAHKYSPSQYKDIDKFLLPHPVFPTLLQSKPIKKSWNLFDTHSLCGMSSSGSAAAAWIATSSTTAIIPVSKRRLVRRRPVDGDGSITLVMFSRLFTLATTFLWFIYLFCSPPFDFLWVLFHKWISFTFVGSLVLFVPFFFSLSFRILEIVREGVAHSHTCAQF